MAESHNRSPSSYSKTLTVAADFDGTIADTFQKSPGGIGIDEACDQAVNSLFNASGLRRYRNEGGLRNRAPFEIVSGLTDTADQTEIDDLTREFIDVKLGILLNEIGTTFSDGTVWPRPMPGYMQLQEGLASLSAQTGIQIDQLILSSGHKQFIQETLNARGIEEADQPFIFGEEMAREHASANNIPVSNLVKPSTELMTTAINMHRGTYGLDPVDQIASADARRITYAGDDPYNDGLMSVNSGVPYVLIRPDKSIEDWEQVGTHIRNLGRAGVVRTRQGAAE